jgi:signal transduction histidine kinase/ligand-binding sensor domain-containing protein/DNA-binding response OmpR family regulator
MRTGKHTASAQILACILLLSPADTFAQTPGISGHNVIVRRMSTEHGLSDRTVLAITQDRAGFIWLGTNDGLNRYDGRTFTVYRNIPGDSTSLSDNKILSLCADSCGYLWIGTAHGLNRFDPATLSFRRYLHDASDSTSISDDDIKSLYQDLSGNVWAGTARGLNRFDRSGGGWTRFFPVTNDSLTQGSLAIYCMLQDHSGTFWVGTGNLFTWAGGLYTFDPKKEEFKLFPGCSNLPKNEMRYFVSSLYEDASGTVWVTWMGSRHILAIDKHSEDFLKLSLPPEMIAGPGTFQRITEDHKGILWIAGWTWGLFGYNRQTGETEHYECEPDNPKTISSPDICTLFLDKSELVWLGTNQGGVTTVARNPFVYRSRLGASFVIPPKVNSLLADRDGNLWLGALDGGTWRFDPRSQKATRVLPDDNTAWPTMKDGNGQIWMLSRKSRGVLEYDPHRQRVSNVWNIPRSSSARTIPGRMFVDSQQSLWLSDGSALYKVPIDRKAYEQYSHQPENPGSLTGDNISSIREDHLGKIWVATDRGLNRFERKTRLFTRFVHEAGDDSSLSSNDITGIFVGHDNRIWIGTENGLNLFHEERNTFSRFYPSGTPAIRSVGQIVEDRKGRIWFSTSGGIVKFDPSTETFSTFDERRGVEPSGFFSWCAPACLPSGELVFGCTEGILVFHPDSLGAPRHVPPIVITGIEKLNQPVALTSSPELVHQVTLRHEENVFSVRFSLLSYERPDLNQYAYKLEGFEKEWVYCGSRQEVSYSNLDPGTFLLRVKGSNHAGLWNEEGTSLVVIVEPAFWQTWWFRSLMIASLFCILATAYRIRFRQMKVKQQAIMEHFQAEHLVEVDRLKSRFFSNISHEFRTPLTLILGPAEQGLGTTADQATRQKFHLIRDNARKLYALVNQLLDFSKVESGMMRLQVSSADLMPFLRRVVMSFESWAERKQIDLEFNSEAGALEGFFDQDKVEKILNNLVSNALKFTSEGGTVRVNIEAKQFRNQIPESPLEPVPARPMAGGRPDGRPGGRPTFGRVRSFRTETLVPKAGAGRYLNSVTISVTDTGPGIPPEHLPHIFDRFCRVDETQAIEGTGIGLALTKELVELHHGTISVESTLGKGSTFVVTIPIDRASYQGNEISEGTSKSEEGEPVSFEVTAQDETNGVPSTTAEGRPIVLVVEDNADLRNYIREYFEQDYAVHDAANGKQGFEQAVGLVPDLVISDIMMPEMDGMELCKTLKQDVRTSHVPVILLTARAGTDSRIEGLEIGADDYVTKPFDSKELLARARNLIEQRRQLRKKFSAGVVLKPGEVAVTSLDDALLQKLMGYVEKHMAEENLGVDDLATEACMSRTHLNRKLHALVNLSPLEFIRYLRLQRAQELLEKNAGSVGEIAYQVGYRSLSYFTAAFKERFGCLPSEVHKNR